MWKTGWLSTQVWINVFLVLFDWFNWLIFIFFIKHMYFYLKLIMESTFLSLRSVVCYFLRHENKNWSCFFNVSFSWMTVIIHVGKFGFYYCLSVWWFFYKVNLKQPIKNNGKILGGLVFWVCCFSQLCVRNFLYVFDTLEGDT